MEIINQFIEYTINIFTNNGLFVGFFLVFIECFLPMLPLSVFVTLNVNTLGLFIGIFISWIATVLGSFICYIMFYYIGNRLAGKKIINKVINATERFKSIKFTELVLIITLPFTPSFLVNILAGVTRMNRFKFIMALLIGKGFSISFWGYIGKTFVSSIYDIHSIIFIIITLVIAFFLSKFVSYKFNIK